MSKAKAAAGPCTVEKYIAVLTHELVRYDVAESARESKRGRANIYRLGLLLEAVGKVREECKGHMGGSPEDIAEFYASVLHNFTDESPRRKLLKQLAAGTCKIR